MSTERRWNPVEQEWLLNVPSRSRVSARADMPDELRQTNCPFCPTSEEMPDEFDMHVLPSAFPVVGRTRLNEKNGSYGHHQVYVYTSDHRTRIPDLDAGQVDAMLGLVAGESERISGDPRVESVYVFEVYGDHFGPTVDHAHGQIVGLPFVPKRIEVERDCSLCALPSTSAFISGTEVVAAIPPYARYPFESVLFPKRHVGLLSALNPGERLALAKGLSATFRAYRAHHGELPPYTMSIVQAPVRSRQRGHLRVEILPLHSTSGRYKRPGGLEVGLGLYTNPLGTEEASKIMRDHI